MYECATSMLNPLPGDRVACANRLLDDHGVLGPDPDEAVAASDLLECDCVVRPRAQTLQRRPDTRFASSTPSQHAPPRGGKDFRCTVRKCQRLCHHTFGAWASDFWCKRWPKELRQVKTAEMGGRPRGAGGPWFGQADEGNTCRGSTSRRAMRTPLIEELGLAGNASACVGDGRMGVETDFSERHGAPDPLDEENGRILGTGGIFFKSAAASAPIGARSKMNSERSSAMSTKPNDKATTDQPIDLARAASAMQRQPTRPAPHAMRPRRVASSSRPNCHRRRVLQSAPVFHQE